jgi:four helix bundle protein
MMPYERFHAWKACDELAVAVYRTTATFPRHELYGLTSQARRAAFSAAANIAEGSAKRGAREFRRDLDALRADASRLTWLLYKRVANASQ